MSKKGAPIWNVRRVALVLILDGLLLVLATTSAVTSGQVTLVVAAFQRCDAITSPSRRITNNKSRRIVETLCSIPRKDHHSWISSNFSFTTKLVSSEVSTELPERVLPPIEIQNRVFRYDKRPVILFDGVCNLCNGAGT